MKTLVTGATGATGRQLVDQLLARGQHVKVIARPSGNIPAHWIENEQVTIIRSGVLDIGPEKMADYIKDCQAVASCLGHNLTLKGMFGKPRKLVADAVKLLCVSIAMNAPKEPVRLILMNTTANRNRDLKEAASFGEKMVLGLLRILLPPQSDNEKAAEHLRVGIGPNNAFIEWVAVRPDTLTNEETVSEYTLSESPTRSAVFNPGKTSRINVGHFMARLAVEEDLWNQWKGRMPVIYNK